MTMKRPLSSLRSAATYVLAAALGWGGVVLLRTKGAGFRTSVEEMRATRTQRSPVAATEGEKVLEDVMTKWKEEREQTSGSGQPPALRSYLDRIAELRKSLKPDADPAAAARKEMENITDEEFQDLRALQQNQEKLTLVAVRVIQWLEADPEAALAYFQNDRVQSQVPQTIGVELWTAEQPIDQIIARLKKDAKPSRVDAYLVSGLCKGVSGKADVPTFLSTLEGLPKDKQQMFRVLTVQNWPKEKLVELMPYAREKKDAKLLDRLLNQMPNADAFRQIDSMLANDTDGQNAKLISRGGLIGKIYQNADVPLEKRMELMGKLNANVPGAKDAAVEMPKMIRNIEWVRVAASAEAGPVLRDFREGSISAEAAMQQLGVMMPDSSRTSPEQTKELLAHELLKRDPQRGLALLDGMPPEQRYDRVMAVAKDQQFTTGNPQRVLDLMQAVPFDAAHGTAQQRFEVWNQVVTHSYARFDDDFVGWVKEMPQGQDRDMALSALALKFDETNPVKAAEYRKLKTESPNNSTPTSDE